MPEASQPVILTIDDETAIRESFRNFLEDLDFIVFEAGDGRKGLEAFRRHSPDLVLVDLRMPEVDGLEVLKIITKESPDTPVIVISGTGVIGDAVEALRLGAWDYLLKPIENLSVLYHAIEKCLERSRLIRENRRYHEYLEAEVADRTRKLEAANRKLQQVNSRLRRLVETTRDLSTCFQVADFGARLLEEFGRHMLATGGSLYLMDEDGLRLIHSLDPGHAVARIAKPIPTDSIIGRVMESGEPQLINDITRAGDFKGSGWHGYTDGSILVFPLPDESGEVVGILSLHSKSDPPFTEQDKEIGSILASYSCEALRASRATEALQESVEKYQLLTENLRDVVLSISPEGDLTYCSPVITEFGGYDAQEVIGNSFKEYFADPGEIAGAVSLLERLKDHPVVDPLEFLYKPKSGKPFPVEVSGNALFKEGEVSAILCVMRDIRERKQAEAERVRLEKQLRQAQKMESIGTLAGGIAHDFNNILSSVIGYTELVLTQLDKHDSRERNLQAVLKAGLRAKELVGQILTFSRQSEQVFVPVRVDTIAKEALKLLRSSIPVTIEIENDIRPSGLVQADPTQIHQVIMNLCTNAYHAMQDTGGTLSVGICPCDIDFEDQKELPDLSVGPHLRLSITDTGEGMSSAVVERIFEPYFTTKEKGKGTGLGLSVVHGIVKSHLGAITVESALRKGTCFTIYLPVSEREEETTLHMEHEALPGGSECVLFVDDEAEISWVGQQMLERLGYTVTTCNSGSEALSLFEKNGNRYDIVITDLAMPGLTGDQLARALINIREDVPIILCTGFSDRINEKKAQEIGIRKFLLKPTSMIDLGFAIREVLDGEEGAGGR